MEFSIATIGLFVGMMNQGFKYIANTFIKVNINKYIPICSVLFGIILGVAGYFIPDVSMGNNIIEAIFAGAAAGGSAVAVHQSYKQLSNSPTQPSNEYEIFDDTVESETNENNNGEL